METTTIILELTQREAESLAALTLRGVAWLWAGETKIGTDAEAIYDALADVGIREPDERVENSKGLPIWDDER